MRVFNAIIPCAAAILSIAGIHANHSGNTKAGADLVDGAEISASVSNVTNTFSTDSLLIASDTAWPPLLGASLRYGIDTTVAPCDDFYQYVNGGWRKNIVLDTSNTRTLKIDFFRDIDRRAKQRLQHIIDSARTVASVTKDSNLLVIAAFHSSCLAADSLNIRSRSPIRPPATKDSLKPKKDSTRAEQCFQRTMNYMGEALGQVYAKDLLANNAIPRMQHLLEAVRAAVRVRISNNPWMTADDKGAALERLDRLVLRVGIPTQRIDFSRLALTSDYQKNIRAIQNFFTDSWYRSVGEDNRRAWKISLIHANAFYMEGEHALEVPPVMFMAPFFDPNAEDLLNFAGIGHVIGHEIFHSVAKQFPVLEGADLPNQIARLKALHSSLGTLDKWEADGQRTFSEDVADLGGMHVAYDAWKASVKAGGTKPAPMVDGYTPDQRFFVAVARIWRAKWRDVPGSTDPHGPPFARINGTLMNMPEFTAAFGCKATDRMVLPADKRSVIW